jgi:hypothetical protein
MKAGVVGRSIGGVNKLQPVLCGFNPRKVVKLYGSDWSRLLGQIEYQIKPRGKIRKTRRSIWPQYCRTILSAARFMSQFSTAKEFYRWVDFFDHDDRARAALPLLLHREIRGVGFTLGCDFLKELGYANFAKPDVHLRDIFGALHLCPKEADDYEVFKAVVRLAKNASVTAYNADKLFWLVGSGYFYDDLQIGRKGRIGSHKWKFVTFAKRRLKSN